MPRRMRGDGEYMLHLYGVAMALHGMGFRRVTFALKEL